MLSMNSSSTSSSHFRMRGSTLLLSFFVFLFLQISQNVVSAYPHVLLIPEPKPNSIRPAPTKRAFDRLDMSPFDFGAMAKRYVFESDDSLDRKKKAFDRLDESAFGFGLDRRKKAFDRLDDSAFDFHTFKKRAFDRLDNGPFGFTKRSSSQQEASRAKRPFDRLDDSVFGLYKRSASIADLARQPDLNRFLY